MTVSAPSRNTARKASPVRAPTDPLDSDWLVLSLMYAFQDDADDLVSIQLLVSSSMTMAIIAVTPSSISWRAPAASSTTLKTNHTATEAASPASTPR